MEIRVKTTRPKVQRILTRLPGAKAKTGPKARRKEYCVRKYQIEFDGSDYPGKLVSLIKSDAQRIIEARQTSAVSPSDQLTIRYSKSRYPLIFGFG